MSTRTIRQLVPAFEVTEGAGVTVHRSIGTPALRNLDPFLMLDHFGSDNPDEYIAGFPDHPHRGFITFTYMLDGHMEHRDSMGNRGDLKAGGAQWMKAASGVIHSENLLSTAIRSPPSSASTTSRFGGVPRRPVGNCLSNSTPTISRSSVSLRASLASPRLCLVNAR